MISVYMGKGNAIVLNLRKKLIIASILMILIPLIVSVLLCVVVIFYKGDSAVNRLKSLYENDNGLLNVQTILYSHENQILSYTPLKYDDDDDDDEYDDDDDDDDDDEYDDDDKYESNVNMDHQSSINYESAANAFGNLIKELEMLRYYYQIRCGDQIIYSNLPEGAEEEKRHVSRPCSGRHHLNHQRIFWGSHRHLRRRHHYCRIRKQ